MTANTGSERMMLAFCGGAALVLVFAAAGDWVGFAFEAACVGTMAAALVGAGVTSL